MKTIALSEKTFNILQKLKVEREADSFDNLVLDIIIEKEKIPSDMFGTLKGKSKSFTQKERKKTWKDRKI